jgi:transcription initiation factor TFIIIB Brf1 subunit/transcription initiation factor TFIIB
MSSPNAWTVCPLDDIVANFRAFDVSNAQTLDCPKCHIEMTKSWNEYNMICPKCHLCKSIGLSGEHHNIGTGESHNTSNNAYMCFKPVGTKNRLYHNTMIKYTSEYEPYRDAQILQLLKQYNYVNTDFTIPQDVLRQACEMFILMRDHDYVRRGQTRRGVLGACIFVQCQKNHIAKTKTQIAKMMQVEESKITFGLDELNQYAKLGVIDMPQNVDPTSDYIDNYFEIFEIPVQHAAFAKALAERMSRKKIEEVGQCFNTTKCIGVIYFLSRHLGLNITHDMISQNCDGMSRGTYLTVTNAITKNEKKLKKAFIKFGVKLPLGWTLGGPVTKA